ncbi:hypothetical protein ABGB07_35190 [Micromonosporaceae bacterium B7E4]
MTGSLARLSTPFQPQWSQPTQSGMGFQVLVLWFHRYAPPTSVGA